MTTSKNFAAERSALYTHRACYRFEEGKITEALEELARARQEHEKAIAGAVHRMRQLNRSWAHIAGILGITRQAAQQKYGDRELEPMTTSYQLEGGRRSATECDTCRHPLRYISGAHFVAVLCPSCDVDELQAIEEANASSALDS